MATVRDFKNEVQTKWWGGRYSGEMTDDRREFWAKLNRMGARNMHREGMLPEEVRDIDETVELLESEFADLTAELARIP